MPDLIELDRARERWRLIRRRMGQDTDPNTQPAGLARRAQNLSARLVILPGDPFATHLSFDAEFWEWWTNHDPAPFGNHVQWTSTEPTIDAALKCRQGSEKCATYLGVHRHGGIELGSDPTWSGSQGLRYVGLVQTVGLVWIGAAAQAEAAVRYGLSGPWELTLVLRQAGGAYLSGFGSGWLEPYEGGRWDLSAQEETHVMIRRELDTFPESEKDIQDLTFDIGARIEDAWGMKSRRFLDRVGDMKGEFNPGRWSF